MSSPRFLNSSVGVICCRVRDGLREDLTDLPLAAVKGGNHKSSGLL